METGNCKLGEERPKVCKEFPQRKSDIKNVGISIGENSICIAKIGGEGCNHCGQCCRDNPWFLHGCPETNGERWSDENGVCIHYTGG